MEYSLRQSSWGRGWNDTKTIWTSWQFVILDAVVGVVIAGIFTWYWGLAVVAFGMICAWVGATASAPVRQRNEAWNVLAEKPKPISNKDNLVRAISTFTECALTEFIQKEVRNEHSCKVCPFMMEDSSAFTQAYKSLSAETLVAGDETGEIVLPLMTFALKQIVAQYDEHLSPKRLSERQFMAKLRKLVDKAIKEIDAL